MKLLSVDAIILFLLCEQSSRFTPSDIITRDRLAYLLQVPAGSNTEPNEDDEEGGGLVAENSSSLHAVLTSAMSSQYVSDPLEGFVGEDVRARRELLGRLAEAFCSSSDPSQQSTTTFAEVLRRVDGRLPFISAAGAERCRQLGKLPIVSRAAIQRTLADEGFGADIRNNSSKADAEFVAAGQAAFFSCVVPTDALSADDVRCSVMGETLVAVADAVEHRRTRARFLVEDFAAYRIDARRHISSIMPFVAILFVACLALVNECVFRDFVGVSALAPTGAWQNYCADGPSGPASRCYFSERNVFDIATGEDVVRFLSVELPSFMWSQAAASPNSTTQYNRVLTGAESAAGDAYFVGALTLRQKWLNSPEAFSCGDLNLSIPFIDGTTGDNYGCGASSFINIPLSLQLGNATQLLSTFLLAQSTGIASTFNTSMTRTESFSLIAEFSALVMPTGLVVQSELSFVFDLAGSVEVQLKQVHSSSTVGENIRMCFIAQGCSVVCDALLLWVSVRRGVPTFWSPIQVILKVLTFGLCCIAFIGSNTGSNPSSYVAASTVVSNMDTMTQHDELVQICWGWWIFFVIVSSAVEILSQFHSTQLVVRLVSRAIGPLFSMFLVFAVWFITLVVASFYIFGRHSVEFSTFYSALDSMFPFVIASGDPTLFTAELPKIGFAFDIVVTVFFSFLVMNIFVGVLMAPLGDLILSDPLATRFQEALSDDARSSLLQSQRRRLLSSSSMMLHRLLPIANWRPVLVSIKIYVATALNILHDTVIVPDVAWSKLFHLLHDRSGEGADSRLRRVVFYAKQLYQTEQSLKDSGGSSGMMDAWLSHPDISRFIKVCRSADIADVSITLVLLTCASESRYWSLLRLGRLLSFLNFADEHLVDEGAKSVSRLTAEGSDTESDEGDGDDRANGDPGCRILPPTSSGSTTGASAASDDDESLAVEMLTAHRDTPPATPPSIRCQNDRDTSPAPPSPKINNKKRRQTTARHRRNHRLSYDRIIGRQIDAVDQKSFSFCAHVKARLAVGGSADTSWLSFLLFVLLLASVASFYVMMTTTVVSEVQHAAMFSQSLHNGLRDATFREYCADPSCKSASTNPMNFATATSKDDLFGFFSRVLRLQLFPGNSSSNSGGGEWEALSIPGINTTGVAWSSVPRLKQMTVRHLRGEIVPCDNSRLGSFMSSGEVNSDPRLVAMSKHICYSHSSFDESPLAIPANSPLDSAAYTFQRSCSEYDQGPVSGSQYTFPCAGFTARIDSLEQLLYVANSSWLGNSSVRFVAINFKFYRRHADAGDAPVPIDYTMYAEFGMRGRFGEFWVIVNHPVVLTMQSIFDASLACFCVAAAAAGLTVLLQVLRNMFVVTVNNGPRQGDNGGYSGSPLNAVAYVNPLLTLLAGLAVLLMMYGNIVTSEYGTAFASLVILVYFTILVIQFVVLPIACLFSRRATTFSRMFSLILARVTPLVPFGIVLWVAFSLSMNAIWGPFVREFATISRSFFTVSRSFLGQWDFSLIQQHFQFHAVVMSIAFFTTVSVVFMPTMLSLVAQCAEEANDQLSITDAIESIARKDGKRIIYGPLARLLLALWFSAKTFHVEYEKLAEESEKVEASNALVRGGNRIVLLARRPFRKLNQFIMRRLLQIVVRILGKKITIESDDTVLCEPASRKYSTASSASTAPGSEAEGSSLTSLAPPETSSLQDQHYEVGSQLFIRFTERERCPHVIECLTSVIGLTQVLQLREALFLDDLKEAWLFTAVAFILVEYEAFCRENKTMATRDARLERHHNQRGGAEGGRQE